MRTRNHSNQTLNGRCAPEILQYFQNFAKKYDLNKYTKFNSFVKETIWDEDECKCEWAMCSKGS